MFGLDCESEHFNSKTLGSRAVGACTEGELRDVIARCNCELLKVLMYICTYVYMHICIYAVQKNGMFGCMSLRRTEL